MISSTARSLKSISEGKELYLQPKTLVNFTFDTDNSNQTLENKLQQLNPAIAGKFTLKNGLVSLKQLENEFKTLCELHGNIAACSWLKSDEEKTQLEEQRKETILSDQDKLTIEEYKLQIIKAILFHFKKRYDLKDSKIQEQPAPPQPSRWRIPLYVFLTICNVLFMAIGGFLGMNEMLKDIFHGISSTMMYLSSGILTSLECIMCYSIMAPFLKKGLGIPEATMSRTLTTIYDEQLQAIADINRALVSEPRCHDKMDVLDYENNIRLAKFFNNHIANIKVEEFKENSYKKGIRWFFSGINTLLTITNGYFMASALLKALAATLVGTPAGWTIIIGVIAIQLVNTYAIRSQSVYEMLNPHVSQIKTTNEKLISFETSNPKFDRILSLKKRAVTAFKDVEKHKILAESHFLRCYRQVRFNDQYRPNVLSTSSTALDSIGESEDASRRNSGSQIRLH